MRVLSMLVWVVCAVEAAPHAQGRVISFTLDAHGGMVLSATLNGAGPYRILLDTGANHSSISDDVARVIGAPPIARAMVSSPAGEREYVMVRVDRLAVGPIAVSATPTAVPARDLALAGEIDGVLGQDVLAGMRYTIDYRRQHIVWEDGDTIRDAGRLETELPLTFRDGLPIVELLHGTSRLRLVADSGAEGMVLFESPGRPLPAMRSTGGTFRVDSFQGSRMARRVMLDEFTIGSTTFRDLPAAVIKPADSPAYNSDGLLPLHIFRRVTFDGPGKRLILG